MVITKSASLGPAFGGHSKAVDEEEEEEEPGGCPWVSVTCFSVLVLIPYVAVRQAWVALIELPFQTGLSFRFFIHPPWKRSIPYHPKRGDQNEIKWIRIEHNITPQWWEGGWVGWGGGTKISRKRLWCALGDQIRQPTREAGEPNWMRNRAPGRTDQRRVRELESWVGHMDLVGERNLGTPNLRALL